MGLDVAWAFIWRPDGAFYEEVRATHRCVVPLQLQQAALPIAVLYGSPSAGQSICSPVSLHWCLCGWFSRPGVLRGVSTCAPQVRSPQLTYKWGFDGGADSHCWEVDPSGVSKVLERDDHEASLLGALIR
jgi:hypothetical protein